MILTGARVPPVPLAIHIYRRAGWRHDLIAALSDEQIEALEAVKAWVPRGVAKADVSQVLHAAAHTAAQQAPSAGQIGEMSGDHDCTGEAA